MSLCSYCIDIVAHELPNRDFDEEKGMLGFHSRRPHHADLAALTASAVKCPLCNKLLLAVGTSPNLHRHSDIGKPNALVTKFTVAPVANGTTSRLEMLHHGILAKAVQCSVNGRPLEFSRVLVKRPHLQIKYDPTFTSPWKIQTPVNLDGLASRSIWKTDIPSEQRLDSRLTVIRDWLKNCQKTHPKCRTEASTQKPCRLVEVIASDGSNVVRLVDLDSLPDQEGVVYNTLSHCWGQVKSANPQTTPENEAEYRTGINFNALPKTYRDAIITTRELGVRYLWVDSLCIIQGNHDDWERESSRMDHVYRNCFLTLAATDASGPDGGLFLSETEPPMDLAYNDDNEHALIRCPGADVERIHVAPLNSRAWALQELILSPRTVHFLSDQLYWQCRTLLLSEDGLVQDDKLSSLRWGSLMLFKPLDFADDFNSRQYWWKIATDYSHREMTVPGDWMAGLAGITRYFQHGMGQTPVLGMWLESLVHDLSWLSWSSRIAGDSMGPATPSWSWMKYEKSIASPMGLNKAVDIFTKIDKCEVVWAGTPLTSLLESTLLLVSGPIQMLKFTKRAGDGGRAAAWMIDGQEHLEFSTCHIDEPQTTQGEEDVMTAPCLLLASYEREFRKSPEVVSTGIGVFLILEWYETDEGESLKSKRIGVGQFDTSKGKPNPFEGAESKQLAIM